MPSVISHAIIGYLLFEEKGAFYSILPDLIGFGSYFTKLGLNYKNINFKKKMITWAPISKMSKNDWFLYNTSHSLILWCIIYYILRDKAIYSAILSIIMDIFLHSNDTWKGPAFLYPFSEYRYDGIHWLSKKGMLITASVIILLLLIPKEQIKKFIDTLP